MEITTREEARSQGLKSFFPGTPCKAGHIAARGIANGQCRECTRLAMEKRRVEFPDLMKDIGNRSHRKRYRLQTEEQREKRREAERARYQANPQPRRDATKRWRQTENGKQKHREHARKWARNNPEKAKAIARRTYEANRQQRDQYARNWYKSNPDVLSAQSARHRCEKLSATPPWLTPEHHDQMKQIYKEARRLTNETGIKHHVDHIFPLRSPVICGLHVPWNLQILTETENSRKRNHFTPGVYECRPL